MRVLGAFLANTIVNFVLGLLVAKFLGPEEYGRFALAFAVAATVQTALFDWLRLAAARFCSARARRDEPEIHATLDRSFVVLAGALAVAGALFVALAPPLGLGDALIALALAAAVVNGLFDYSAALLRARFEDRLYVRVVLVKNALSFALMGGGALLFHSAGVALAGAVASLLGAISTARSALHDPGVSPRLANEETARALIVYGAPIVAANMLYQFAPLAARAVVADVHGFAEAGQFALAQDIGVRAVQALGSALDVLLFQIAVAAHERRGPEEAREQLARNMSLVAALLLPACAGIWLAMPSIEALIVPAEFRGPFGRYLSLLLPGLLAMGLVQFAINPVFQIAKATAPLVAAATVGMAAGVALAVFLPRGADASSLALAQCGAYVAALVTLAALAVRAGAQWPPLRDILAALVATGAMTLALWPSRGLDPGLSTLALQVGAGAGLYGALILLFDAAGLRGLALTSLRPLLARGRGAL